MCKMCETRPMVYHPDQRRLEILTIYRCLLQKQHFLLKSFKDHECWCGLGLNKWPPTPHTGAYPIELTGCQQLFQIHYVVLNP